MSDQHEEDRRDAEAFRVLSQGAQVDYTAFDGVPCCDEWSVFHSPYDEHWAGHGTTLREAVEDFAAKEAVQAKQAAEKAGVPK